GGSQSKYLRELICGAHSVKLLHIGSNVVKRFSKERSCAVWISTGFIGYKLNGQRPCVCTSAALTNSHTGGANWLLENLVRSLLKHRSNLFMRQLHRLNLAVESLIHEIEHLDGSGAVLQATMRLYRMTAEKWGFR